MLDFVNLHCYRDANLQAIKGDKMQLRRVTDFEEHFKRILKLERKVFPRPIAACKATNAALADLVAQNRYYAWDAWEGDECIGSTSFWVGKARGGPLFATFNSSAILEPYRGKGLYRRMLQVRIRKIKQLELPFFEIQCAERNEKMATFWRKMVEAGKVRPMKSYYINYYSYRSTTRMLEFRGRTNVW